MALHLVRYLVYSRTCSRMRRLVPTMYRLAQSKDSFPDTLAASFRSGKLDITDRRLNSRYVNLRTAARAPACDSSCQLCTASPSPRTRFQLPWRKRRGNVQDNNGIITCSDPIPSKYLPFSFRLMFRKITNKYYYLPLLWEAYWCTCVPVHRCTDVPVYLCTGEPVYKYTLVPVYYHNDVPVHQCMHR